MPRTKAQQRATAKWNAENMSTMYDRINLLLPKGRKDELKALVSKLNKKSGLIGYDRITVNGFINSLIENAIHGVSCWYSPRDCRNK